MKRQAIGGLILTAFLCLCSTTTAAQEATVFTIKNTERHQTIDGFGASDAWSMNRIGLWADSVRQQTADWLFSTAMDDKGQPRGIGLSIWRFNLGAGSAEQGRASQIQRLTRTECFRNADGTYDWQKQHGQVEFLKMARRRGVPHLLAFLNSSPVFWTKNGLATNTGRDGTLNLREECYDSVAVFLADVMEGLKKHHGIHIDWLSPLNEPDGHWNWLGPKQEGTPSTNREAAALTRKIAGEFRSRRLDTRIMINESSDYRCMYRTHETDWQRGHHVRTFFSPDSTATYMGDLPNVSRIMAAHGYWTNTPVDTMRAIRERLRRECERYGVDLWHSEICIMGNDTEIGGGHRFDFGMKTALYVARIIHYDLVFANARSWQWWRAAGGDYKDGLLREYDDTPHRGGSNARQQGRVKDSKLLWALGNYSRFIRPGAVRLGVQASDSSGNIIADGCTDPYGLMCSAYRNADDTRVAVVINYSEQPKPFTLLSDDNNGKTTGSTERKWTMYRTSALNDEHISPVGEGVQPGKSITIPARSVVTIVER